MARIYVAGHTGLVGSAIVRRLRADADHPLILRTRAELDLTDPSATRRFFRDERPDIVFLAAARVGGIGANAAFPGDFIRDNLLIQTHVIHEAWAAEVSRLIFLGSSCIYPRMAAQPITEDALLTGPLEPTNDAYAVAKIAGITMMRAYRRQHGLRAIALMPTNLYGPGDNFDVETAHVLPALMRRFDDARAAGAAEVTVWGTGTPRRELLHVDDLADAAVFLMRAETACDLVNVGSGVDLPIRELAELVREVVGFRGALRWDPSRPDGTPRKLLDSARLAALGWRPRIALRDGVEATYRWYREQSW